MWYLGLQSDLVNLVLKERMFLKKQKNNGFEKISTGPNFKSFWSWRKFWVSRIMYCSRSVDFRGVFFDSGDPGVPLPSIRSTTEEGKAGQGSLAFLV